MTANITYGKTPASKSFIVAPKKESKYFPEVANTDPNLVGSAIELTLKANVIKK